MKKKMQSFLFGSNFSTNTAANIVLLLFRLHIGLSLAFGAGLPKMQEGLAPTWFIKQVGEIGFTFISPTFWATIASWGEFIGGICLALGLLTRFSALQLSFQFFVIAFVWYDNPMPILGMYFQNTLFMSYLLVVFIGGGRFSIDNFIMTKKNQIMPILRPAITAVLLLFSTVMFSQNKEALNGSGNVITKNYQFKNFDKINISDICGKVIVNLGKPFAITATVDDNFIDMFSISEVDEKLILKFKDNKNNKKYIENCATLITIDMPKAVSIKHSSNAALNINGVQGQFFAVENKSNGGVTLAGTIQDLEIKSSGNGAVDASKIMAKNINIIKSDNGSVAINTDTSFTLIAKGNGSVTNYGVGKASSNSSIMGNGIVHYKNKNNNNNSSIPTSIPNNKIVKIYNITDSKVALKVKYPVSGKYGISVNAGETLNTNFPAGTIITKKGEHIPLYTVTSATDQYFIISDN